jgi:2'-5' RNA ligase
MPYAVTLTLHQSFAEPLAAMSRMISALAGSANDRVPAFMPHLTLAVCPDKIAENDLRTVIERVSEGWDALDITLVGFGVFTGSPSFLWLAPVVTKEMLDRHAELQAALSQCHLLYRPGSWVPHVTLGPVEPSLTGRALDAIQPLWTGPYQGRADKVELVRFDPVKVLGSRVLSRPSPFLLDDATESAP